MEQTVKAKNERHLLIVDDDSDMRLLLAEYFRRLGYEVEERESAAAALEVCGVVYSHCLAAVRRTALRKPRCVP